MNKRANFSAREPLAVLALLGIILAALPVVDAQESASTNKVIPIIVMDEVPLSDAIANLARMAGINYILDPSLSNSRVKLSGRWENITAKQALTNLLQTNKLVMTDNSSTSVARIASSNHVVKPLSADQAGDGTNQVIPVIVFDEVPLDEAIKKLAAQANLNVIFDPRLTGAFSGGSGQAFPTVSLRWQNVTARQALTALLDNYDLMMVEGETTGVTRPTIKKQVRDKTSPQKSGKD